MFRQIVAAAAATFATWDQTRVAQYAGELTIATADLRKSFDALGMQNVSQQNAMYQVKDTIKMLDTASGGLAEALANGKGRDETMPRYKRVESLRRDAELEGRSADIPDAVFEKVFDVGNALIKLRPYYVDESTPEEKQAE
jgi:hypothetical protein